MVNKKRLLTLLIPICSLFLFVLVGLHTSTANAQTINIDPITLTDASNLKLLLQVKPVSYQNGKWTYQITWDRVRNATGSVYITAKTNSQTIIGKSDPAPRVNTSNPLTVQLDPATRYLIQFYATPSTDCNNDDPECVIIFTKYFNSRDANGNPVATSQIPVSRGGTLTSDTDAGTSTGTSGTGTTSGDTATNALQAQINQLMALVQSLIAQLTSQGGSVAGINTGGTTGATVALNTPVGASCTGSISTTQSSTISADHNRTGSTQYTVTTPTGNVTCQYGTTTTPGNLVTRDNPNGYDLTQQFSPQAGVYMTMRANDEGYNGPSDAPEPILVMRNGKKYGNTQAEIIANPDPNNTRVIEAYASVGSKFLSGIHFNIPASELCQSNSKVKIEGPTSPNVPGLTWHSGPDKNLVFYDKGACTFGWWSGTPSTPGRYVFEYKITSNLGSVEKVTTTKINIVVKRTSIFDMSVVPNSSYKADGTMSPGPVIGGRTLITWDQRNLLRGNTTFDRMNLYIAPGDQSGKDPRYVTDKYVIDEDTNAGLRIVGACNSTGSGGAVTAENPNAGYGCGRYNWLVGSTRAQNLTPGTYTLFVAPYIPVLDKDNLVPIMYTNSDDSGAAYGYGSVVVTIGEGTLPAIATGTGGDFGFLRGGIHYVRKSSSGSVLATGVAEYGLGRGTTISVDPTDSLELRWDGYFPSARSCVLINTANGSLCKQICDMSGCHDDTVPVAQMDNAGTAWSSAIRVTNGVTNYEVATLNALRARVATAFPTIPGGFDNIGTSGFMNTPNGTYTITGAQMQRLQGLGFSLSHTVWNGLFGCTNCTSIAATLYVNVGVGNTTREIGLGNANSTGLTTSAGIFNTDTCRLPDENNMSAAVSPSGSIFTLENGRNEGTGYNSYTTTFANLLGFNDASGNPYKFSKLEFSVGTNSTGCSGGSCIVSRTVMDLGANNPGIDSTSFVNPVSNRTGAQFVGGLTPNTTYYNQLKYTCANGNSRTIIWPVNTTGPGNIIQQNGGTIGTGTSGGTIGGGATPTLSVASTVLGDTTGSGTSCSIGSANSYYAGWNTPTFGNGVTFNPGTNATDRIVFRAKAGTPWTYNGTSWVKSNASLDTDAQTAVKGGCTGVDDGSTNLSTCVKNNNAPTTPPATFYPVTGATPHTTYWNRVAYVKDYGLPTIRIIDDKVWSCTMP